MTPTSPASTALPPSSVNHPHLPTLVNKAISSPEWALKELSSWHEVQDSTGLGDTSLNCGIYLFCTQSQTPSLKNAKLESKLESLAFSPPGMSYCLGHMLSRSSLTCRVQIAHYKDSWRIVTSHWYHCETSVLPLNYPGHSRSNIHTSIHRLHRSQ